MKVIITSYAITSGVKVVDGEVSRDYPSMVGVLPSGFWTVHKPNWHDNKEDAEKAVRLTFEKRLKSLKKAISILPKKLDKALKVIKEADLGKK